MKNFRSATQMKAFFASFLFILAIGIVGAPSLIAQTPGDKTNDQEANPHGKFSIGLLGGLNFNGHTANFATESGLQACGTFTGGNGIGPFFGGLFEYPLSRNLSLGAILSFDALGATMNASAPLGDARATDGSLVPVTEQNKIVTTLNYLSLTPSIQYFYGDHIFLNMGPVLGIAMTKNFTQTLTNQLASNTPVINTPPTLPSASGVLQNGNGVRLAINVMLGYESILSGNNWHLDPFVRLQAPLTQVTSVSSDQWSATAISVGFEAKYTFFEQPPPPLPPPPPPPPPKPMPRLSASVDAVGVDDKGIESQVVQLQVEEEHTFETFPMLPYVFFPEGQSELPAKYVRVENIASFSEKTIRGGTMEMYYNMLNIVGKRMHDYPRAKLTLTGCNDNIGAEMNNLSLSLSRAESVKKYLNDVWHVTPDRIIVSAVNLPDKASNSSTPQGQAENRRVEITSDVPQIFEPIPLDIVERTTTPSTIKITPHVVADNGLRQWDITVWQEGKTLKDISGTGAIPDHFDWDPSDRDNSSPSADRIFYKINVTDNAGISYTSPEKFLSVDQFTETQATGSRAYKISRFSLILFDFGKATLDPRNEDIVDQILKRVEPNSAVLVNGYADSLGGEQYNLELSQKRAQATSDLIVKRCPFHITPTVVARGSSNLYDADDTPEGRYLSRTVEVLVRTPISE